MKKGQSCTINIRIFIDLSFLEHKRKILEQQKLRELKEQQEQQQRQQQQQQLQKIQKF